jgi:hypothetical protein
MASAVSFAWPPVGGARGRGRGTGRRRGRLTGDMGAARDRLVADGGERREIGQVEGEGRRQIGLGSAIDMQRQQRMADREMHRAVRRIQHHPGGDRDRRVPQQARRQARGREAGEARLQGDRAHRALEVGGEALERHALRRETRQHDMAGRRG